MKKIYFLCLSFLVTSFGFTQGTETFDNFIEPNTSYVNGTFTGQDGSIWTYTQARGDYEITGSAIMIGRNRTPQSEFYSGTISGGIGTISFDYMQAFGTNVNLNVLVNDVVVGNVTSLSEQGVVKSSGTITVDVPGDVVIKFINVNNSDGQVVVDNIVWTGSGGVATPSLSITSPTNGAEILPGSNILVEFNALNFDIATSGNGDGHLHYTVNGGGVTMVYTSDPIDLGSLTSGAYTIDLELVDDSHNPLDPAVTASVSFTVLGTTQVANLAALRADFATNGPGTVYELMSVPTVTYTRTSRNQKYIQDATAGILIDDTPGTITTTFAIGDGISGLVGTASEFNGVLQFVPSQDANVTAGSTVTPVVVTIATLLTDWEDYESQLVLINNATFADAGGTFAAASDYDLSDGSVINFRTNFSEADYIGQTIPSGANALVGFVNEFGGNPQITSRSLADVTLSIGTVERNNFSVYPNPTSVGYVTISSTNTDAMSVAVFDVLGKQVLSQTVNNNRLDVTSLNSGIYIVKISQNDATITKKLVVK